MVTSGIAILVECLVQGDLLWEPMREVELSAWVMGKEPKMPCAGLDRGVMEGAERRLQIEPGSPKSPPDKAAQPSSGVTRI